MLAQNTVAEPDTEYILHTQKPRFLAKRTPGGLSDFEIVEEYDNVLEFYGNALKVAGVLRRLADWYIAYKKGVNDDE